MYQCITYKQPKIANLECTCTFAFSIPVANGNNPFKGPFDGKFWTWQSPYKVSKYLISSL